MPPKAKKSKKEIEEEKSKLAHKCHMRFVYRETRGRKEDSGGAGQEESRGRGENPQDRGGEETH